MDDQADIPTEADSEFRWLSYHQIAVIRGISPASAARMARLHSWRRRKNNSGATVCAVPLAYAEPERGNPPENPTEIRPKGAEIDTERAAISALYSAVDTLRNQLIRADQRADRAEAERDAARAELAVASRAAAADRERADALHNRLDAAQAEAGEARQHAREAEDALEALRRAEAERKGRGRWARLRAAWRGN